MVMFKNPPDTGRTQSAMSSSVRGRISGPIPMDDEFPARKPGSVAAYDGGDARQLQSSAAGSSNLTSAPVHTDTVHEEKTESVTHSGPSPTSNASASPQNRRTMRHSTVRYSTVSNDSGPSRPQRKKSSALKNTLGRIFGRKKKSTSTLSGVDVPIPEPTSPTPPPQHRNDNPAHNNHGPPKEAETKRSASLPLTEYSKALRSHSIGPTDMVAIESARNSLQLEPARRRATTSSRILSAGSSDVGGEMVGLTPRPASAHGRGSRVPEAENPENIGRAITSDSLAHRRRSRSLSQLQDIVNNQTEIRRRSAEIRYWRSSQDQERGSSRGGPDGNNYVDTNPPANPPPAEPSPAAPQQPSLTFAPIANMKSIEAAGSLEDRVAALEARNSKLLKVVSQLFEFVPGVDAYAAASSTANGPSPPFTFMTSGSAPGNASLYRALSDELHPQSRQSDESFGDGNTFIGSAPVHRPTSNTTLRGTVRETSSMPTLHKDTPSTFTADHYTTLKALLDTEIAARQALESQVKKLTHRVNRMSRAEQGPEPAANLRNGTLSMFEHDDEEEDLPTPSYDNYSESEAFKTPHEEFGAHDFGSPVQDEEFQEEEFGRKRAPRTLSLGQLTLGKPPREQREFQSPEVGADL